MCLLFEYIGKAHKRERERTKATKQIVGNKLVSILLSAQFAFVLWVTWTSTCMAICTHCNISTLAHYINSPMQPIRSRKDYKQTEKHFAVFRCLRRSWLEKTCVEETQSHHVYYEMWQCLKKIHHKHHFDWLSFRQILSDKYLRFCAIFLKSLTIYSDWLRLDWIS